MTTLVKTIADFSTTLTAKTAVGATTATLTSGLDSDGIQLPTGTYGFTIDRNESTKEFFTATLTGASLTNIEHVTVGTGAGTSGLNNTHRRGAEVIITDHVALKRMMNNLDGTTDFDSTVPLKYDGTASITNDNEFSTKAYVDGIAIAGSPDASTTTKGISEMSTAPVSATEPIAVGDNDPRVPTQDENDAMVGTSGTPSSTNKFVTNDDTSATSVISKIVRQDTSGKIDVGIIDSGTTANKIVALDALAKLPAVDGSQLTNVTKYSSGTFTKLDNEASVVQNIAHGLGKIPTKVIIAGITAHVSEGDYTRTTYNGTTQSSIYAYNTAGGTTQGFDFAIADSAGYGINVGVVTFDATNIIITWTYTATAGGATFVFLWEAEA